MDQLQAMVPSHNVSSKHAHSAFTVISQPSGASWSCCHASHDMCLTHSVVSASWTWVCVCLHSRLPVAASINLVFLWTSTCSYLLYLMVSAFICLTATLPPPPTFQLAIPLLSGLLSLSQSAPATRGFFLLLQLLKKSFPTLPGLWEIPWKHTL